jgi:peptidoglycan/LPS O-acetylase OafA/YrhL
MPEPVCAAAPERADASGSKMDCFEAIRGLAALAVVMLHMTIAFWPGLVYREGPQWQAAPIWLRTLIRFPGKFLINGSMAVTIFFILSGFVLSLSFFKKGSASVLGPAALRRYPRLMFPIAGSVLLTVVLMKAGVVCSGTLAEFRSQCDGTTLNPAAKFSATNPWYWLNYWYNFTPDFRTAFHQATWDAFSGLATYNLVLWTMPIELKGSFLVYGFLALFGGLRLRWLLYVVFGAITVALDPAPLVAGEYYMLDFILGMALCDVWVHNQRTWRKTIGLAPALVLVAVGLFALPLHLKPLSALLVVGAAAVSPRLQQVLSTRWLALLGRLSFGIYLIHMVILCSVGCGTYLLLCRDLGWSPVAASLCGAAATLAVTALAGWAFYHVFDRPTIAFTRWMDGWVAGGRLLPAALSVRLTPMAAKVYAVGARRTA